MTKDSAVVCCEKTEEKARYALLDSLRGLVLLSMILYHGVYDYIYLLGGELSWYEALPGYIWQQSICWSFIFISGISWHFGKHHGKRGCLIFMWGVVITGVTVVFLPDFMIVFGILNFIGAAMLILIPLEPGLKQVPEKAGLICAGALFFLTRNINDGWIGFEGMNLVGLPSFLYSGQWLFFLGFPGEGFHSEDYFPILPWIFLYLCGYFTWKILSEKIAGKPFLKKKIPGLAWMGRHSLVIYLLHQPVLLFFFFALSGGRYW